MDLLDGLVGLGYKEMMLLKAQVPLTLWGHFEQLMVAAKGKKELIKKRLRILTNCFRWDR